jgi:hypothetical protein
MNPAGEIQMTTGRLDLNGLLAELDAENASV